MTRRTVADSLFLHQSLFNSSGPIYLTIMPARPEAELAVLQRELSLLREYPKEKLAAVIRDVGFSCTCCGRCCTKAFNGHVFLLAEDTRRLREFAPEAMMPAPDFPYSDPQGTFYVSGYALRTQENGDCVFLSEDRRCTIYDRRFAICRIYPYMLHREPDRRGHVDWRQISGLDEHGEYDTEISADDAADAAEAVMAYETACLQQEIAFHEALLEKFREEEIRFVRKDHDLRMRNFRRGGDAVVMVWNGDGFTPETVSGEQYR